MDGMKKLLRKTRRKIRHHGLGKALYAAILRVLGQLRVLNVLRCHYLEEVNPAFLLPPRRYAGGFLAPRELAELARDPEASVSEEFLGYALSKGDKCYGFACDGALRAYGWYASTPTRVSRELQLHFSRDYIYMYKAFTHEAHRGRRLFPFGVTRALKHYRAAGYKGMVLYVDANNLDSLKSCARMGFRVFGTLYVGKLLGRYLILATPGCARFGFRVEVVPAAAHKPRAATISPST
jgi:L-amino acid N-acyltransferase YncA